MIREMAEIIMEACALIMFTAVLLVGAALYIGVIQ